MGRDKAMLPFGDSSVIQTLIVTVQPLFTHTVLSVKELRPALHVPSIVDASPIQCPLSGVVTALAQIKTSWAFVVACDMPFMTAENIRLLAGHRVNCQAVVARVQGHLQPLAAFYSRRCLAALQASLSSGDLSLSSALKQLEVKYVEEQSLLPAAATCFFDVDTPDDWTKALSLLDNLGSHV